MKSKLNTKEKISSKCNFKVEFFMKRKLMLFLSMLFISVGIVTAQTQVRGVVVDETGEPVIGATIQVKGTSQGTITDFDGNFALSAPANATLVFSYVGMNTQEMAATPNMRVVMESDAELLDEVVVTGYGTGRKISSTIGSVSRVTPKDIVDKPVANAFDALQGKVPGLQIFTSTGEPSEVSSMRLHGSGSLGASSTPLFILDGVPVQSSTIRGLNPKDFESIQVLKDAAATSIYGARAANGVVYITTKRGKVADHATVTISGQYGVSSLANTDYYDSFMNSEELFSFWQGVGYRSEAQINDLRTKYPHDTKWYKFYHKDDAPTYQSDISINGGAGRTNYFVSLGLMSQDGLRYRSKYERYNLRTNLNTEVNSWMKMGLNFSVSLDEYQSNPYDWNSTNGGLAMLTQPYFSPYDEDGNEYPDIMPGVNRYNPKYLADKMPDPTKNVFLTTTGFVEFTPLKDLTLRTQAGLEGMDSRNSYARLPSYKGSLNDGQVYESFARRANITVTNTAEYKYSIDDTHSFIGLLGHEYVDYDHESFSAQANGFTDDRLILLSAGTKDKVVTGGKNQYAFLSYFGRLEYDYQEKYFLNFSLRNDESSRFGADNRAATFWATGAMWQAKKEDFLKDVNWLDALTLKFSIGTSGNAEIGNYSSYALVGGAGQYNSGTAWGISAPGNPQLTWEDQTKTTFGVKFDMFKRVRADIEVYNRITSNMLVIVHYPYTSGFEDITENVGKLKNSGVDFRLDVDVWKDRKGNSITPYLTFNYNKEEVLELFQDKEYWVIPNTGVAWAVGQARSFFYPIFKGVNTETCAPEWFLPGENIVENHEDPSKVSSNFNAAALEQSTGINRYAPINGGFGLSANYNGLYLQADFAFALGKYLISNDAYFFENPNGFPGYNQRKVVNDYWKKPGDVARFPDYDKYLFTQFDSRLIENASFMRMKNLTLGYVVPKSILNKTNFFTGAKIFLTGRNLLTVTNYSGVDPEVDSNLTLGVNPNTKQYSVGVEFSF